MTREEILAAAQKCVCGDREQDYGSPERSFGVIGQFWETYLQEKCLEPRCGGPPEVQILPEDVAAMMCLFKIARLDRLLLDLLRDHQALIPFGERYPEIREITYGPRRAGKEGKA